MFDNIGKKIKSLAVIITRVEFAAFIIAGIALMIEEEFLIGLLVGGLGCLFAWLTSFFIYAFGELVDKVQDIEKNTRKAPKSTSTLSANLPNNNYNEN